MKRHALRPGCLSLDIAEFERRRREGGKTGEADVSYADPAGCRQAAATAVGELLQEAAGVQGELQEEYWRQGMALVERCGSLMRAPPASLCANWASLQRLGLDDSVIAAIVKQQPSLLSHNWEGEAKQRLADWLQQELGLLLVDFLTQHSGYVTNGVARMAMRAAFLHQRRPGVWEERRARGDGPTLSLLTITDIKFSKRVGCTPTQLQAFERAWLPTPEGRRWGVKPWRPRRHSA